MECTPVVPKGHIATLVSLRIAPSSEPDLQIMVFVDQAREVVQNELTLVNGHTKNTLGKVTVNKHTEHCQLPSVA
jgi:hypothetical protein